MPLVPVSVLIPTKNEILNISNCLETLSGWADEIVVLDSQSSDGTIAAAESHGAKVIQFHYQGGWPKKRQWALEKYPFRNEWILLLDADEILLEPVKQEIAEAIKDQNYSGYWVPFQIYFLGRMLKHGGTKLWKLCLFRWGKAKYEQRLDTDENLADYEIHEQVLVDGPTHRLNSPIRHENINSLDRYIEKHNTYSTWEAKVWLTGKASVIKPRLRGSQAERYRWMKHFFLELPASPLACFFYMYVLKLGFLDGQPGFIYCVMRAVQCFHVKSKIYEMRTAQESPG